MEKPAVLMLLVGLCCVALTLSPVTAQTPYQDCGKHHLSSAADSSVYLSPTTTGSRGLSIASVNVVNCTQRLCQLKRGDNVTAKITFTASKYPPAPACMLLYCNKYYSNPLSAMKSWYFSLITEQDFRDLTMAVVGFLGRLPVHFDLPDPSVCDHGVACPIQAGKTVTETLTSYVSKTFPSVRRVDS